MKLEKIHYQSDWAEAGYLKPLNNSALGECDGECVHRKKLYGADFRWVLRENNFESEFYGFPVRELRLEIEDPGGEFLNEPMDSADLHRYVFSETADIMRNHAWEEAYIYSRLIRHEPLFGALIRLDFIEVELRRLFGCHFGDLKGLSNQEFSSSGIHCRTLADFSSQQMPMLKEQILELCRESFSCGHTRHYKDSLLSGIRPGIEYILAVMELNFQNIEPGNFLVAVTEGNSHICGFSVLGKKSGIEGSVYTQLLSAVSSLHRGKGVYRRLTELAARIFPPGEALLNVTHVQNRKIQRAYHDSGRRHVADSVVLRRAFQA